MDWRSIRRRLEVDPGSTRGRFGVSWKSILDRSEVDPGSIEDRLEVDLESTSGRSMVDCRTIQDRPEVEPGSSENIASKVPELLLLERDKSRSVCLGETVGARGEADPFLCSSRGHTSECRHPRISPRVLQRFAASTKRPTNWPLTWHSFLALRHAHPIHDDAAAALRCPRCRGKSCGL
jgi:hypothetical protein